VLATVPSSRDGSGSGSDPEPNRCNGSYHTKTQTVAIGPVLPPTIRHFNFTSLAPIQYLSSDCIMTRSICKLCRFMRSFTSHFQIWDLTNISWVVIENPRITLEMWRYFTTILRILVGSQIEKREVNERINLHNLHIHHVTIRSELIYLFGTKVVGTG